MAMQNDDEAHDTPIPEAKCVVIDADQLVPLKVKASPMKSIAPQNELVGHEIAANAVGEICVVTKSAPSNI
jgi:hypothetical protein